jgi:hypothetical protein
VLFNADLIFIISSILLLKNVLFITKVEVFFDRGLQTKVVKLGRDDDLVGV